MLVGEGPGVGEDVLGRPFVGPSGQLLRSALHTALQPGQSLTVCLTNILACRPFATKPSSPENRAPTHEEAEACFPRLAGLVELLQPRMVLACGLVPDKYVPDAMMEASSTAAYEKVRHPAWVIRQSDKDLAFTVYVESIEKAFSRMPTREEL